MITSELRELTREGLETFRSWLDRAENNLPKRFISEPPPTEILFDERYSGRVGLGGPLLQRRFERKYDLGMEVCRALGRENAEKIINMPKVWPWLSLFFYETAFPRDKKGRWFTGAQSRHLIQTIQNRKQDQSHRHLVKGAVTNVLRFGEYAVVLGTDIGQSKIEEQVMSRRVYQPLAYHKEFVKTLYRLYWNAEADDMKSGASGEGPGSIMHMIDLLTQFDLTFDISSLEADHFLRILPKDFDRFRSEEGKPSRRRTSRKSWIQRLRGDGGEPLTT